MKRYNEYSKTELAQVSQEELQTLIDLELAHAGILPEIKPTELPPFDAGIKPTETFYEVFGVLFVNQSDALAVSEMEVVSEDYNYDEGGYKYKYPCDRSNAVSTKLLYKRADLMKAKFVLTERKEAEDVYEEANKKYIKFLETTSNIRSKVNNTYYDACNFVHQVDLAEQMLEKYRTLADGNEEIARNFLRNVYKSSPDVLEEVLKVKEV